jgi:hypothetical protein
MEPSVQSINTLHMEIIKCTQDLYMNGQIS